MRAEYEIDVAGCRSIDSLRVCGMLINNSLIIRAFVECVRFERAIYLIKRSVWIRRRFDGRECCVRQAWQIENYGFLSNVTTPKFESFFIRSPVGSYFRNHIYSVEASRSGRTYHSCFFSSIHCFFFNSFLASIQKFIVSFFIDLVFSGCSLAWAARTQNLFREITIYCIGNTYGVCVHTLHISCWCRRRRSPSIDSSSFSMLRFGIWIERTRALDVRPRNAERTKCWAASSKNVKIEMHASVFDVRTPRFLIYL